MSFTLTPGAVGKLLQGIEVTSPTLQVLGYKKIPGQGGADRYRVNISDGVHSHNYAMLATQLNYMIPEGKIDNNCIIRADKVVSNFVTNKRVLIILELTILAKGGPNKIGNPAQWTEASAGVGVATSIRSAAPRPASNGAGNFPSNPTPSGTAQAPPGNRGGGGGGFYGDKPSNPPAALPDISSGPIVPIRDLNPYTSRCTIRARVTNKGDIRTWSNAKGEGKLFSFELLDESGEVRMTGFNTAVDQYYELLEVGSIYIIKNFQIKPANRQFNKLSHDYELSMGNETQVIPCNDGASEIPTATYNFVEIARIEQLEKDSIIDVIGICKVKGELSTFTSRAGKEMTKRELILVDRSNREIALTLWGKQAEEFCDDSQPVIAVKGAKVGDYNGKNLSSSSSGFHVNPDISEAHILRGWFDNEGRYAESKSLSSGAGNVLTPWKVLQESIISDVADSEKGDFFMSKVTVMSIRRENPAYMACPIQNCNKKVIDLGDGSYKCEKCNMAHQSFNWRMMLSVSFADFSGNVWATCFQDTAETLLGKPSDVIGPMHKEHPDEFDAIIKNALFRSYIAKFKSKVETFNNETRRKANVIELHPLNFSEYAKKLAVEIKESAY